MTSREATAISRDFRLEGNHGHENDQAPPLFDTVIASLLVPWHIPNPVFTSPSQVTTLRTLGGASHVQDRRLFVCCHCFIRRGIRISNATGTGDGVSAPVVRTETHWLSGHRAGAQPPLYRRSSCGLARSRPEILRADRQFICGPFSICGKQSVCMQRHHLQRANQLQ